jgi:negative regulator of sigma E activity
MDKSEAIHILNIESDADLATIQRAYKEKTTDLRQRVSDAPSHLKPDFEARLQLIERAYQLLAVESMPRDWLPAAERVSAGAGDKQSEVPGIAAPVFQAAKDQHQASDFWQKSAKWFFGGMILCLSLAAYFGIKANTLSQENKKLKPLAEKLTRVEKLTQQGKFIVTNSGNEPFSIYGGTAWYLKDTTLVSYTKALETPVLLKPGANHDFKEFHGAEKTYNGDVLFWAITYEYGGVGTFHSGVCHDKEGIFFAPERPVSK